VQCPQCGLSIDANAAFCPTCGWVRAAGAPAAPAAEHWASDIGTATALPAGVMPAAPGKWVAILGGVVVAELAVWIMLLLPWYAHATRHWNHTAAKDVADILVFGSLGITALAILVYSPLSDSFFASLDRNSLKDPDDYGVHRYRGYRRR